MQVQQSLGFPHRPPSLYRKGISPARSGPGRPLPSFLLRDPPAYTSIATRGRCWLFSMCDRGHAVPPPCRRRARPETCDMFPAFPRLSPSQVASVLLFLFSPALNTAVATLCAGKTLVSPGTRPPYIYANAPLAPLSTQLRCLFARPPAYPNCRSF